MTKPRDHGGGLDAAVATFGGARDDWVDLSTGINPVPYSVDEMMPADVWTALPDANAQDRLNAAARAFWKVPDGADIIAAPGASALIARMPYVSAATNVSISDPTYNEHRAAFDAAGIPSKAQAQAQIVVHPNNPDGRVWDADGLLLQHRTLTVIDESFCDIIPEQSLIGLTNRDGIVCLKSFGKFWGLAGMRLGFAICTPPQAAKFRDMMGPWAVSGPALEIGARALEDIAWAEATRARLTSDAARLDALMLKAGVEVVGGTDLFRLYNVGNAAAWQDRLAKGHIWSRIFPYSSNWLRLGLPAPDQWDQLEAAL
jgi:cobalamin biosynthetic protein CobC